MTYTSRQIEVLSAERREEVRELWFEVVGRAARYGEHGGMITDYDIFWRFVAALEAQYAERVRAEVERRIEEWSRACLI